MPNKKKEKEENSVWRKLKKLGRSSSPVTTASPAASLTVLPIIPGPIASPTGQIAGLVPYDVDGKTLLELSLQKLSKQEADTLEQYTTHPSQNIGEIVQSTLEVAKDAQSMCERKQWTVTFRSRTFILRDISEKVVKWLDRFKSIGDIAANADPIHAGLPWAGVRMLLDVALAEHKQMSILITGLNIVLYMSLRLDLYLQYLWKIPSSNEKSYLQSRLVELYVVILRFLAEAIHIYQKSTSKRILEAFLKLSEVEEFEENCQRRANDVEVAASSCDRIVAFHESENLKKYFSDLQSELKILATIDSSLEEVRNTVAIMWTHLEENKRAEILKWSSDIPYEDNHRTALKGHTPDTGDWIFQDDNYQSWATANSSKLLWLHGNGKHSVNFVKNWS
jgi:hypothetical protein